MTDIIKAILTTLSVLSIFFIGMNYALKHPKLSKDIMHSTFGSEYK